MKPKLIAGGIVLLYLAGLGLYIHRAYSENQAWQGQRQQLIAASPNVYLTQTGKKYHQAYHYAGRNYPTSLYEATEAHYEACMVCRPHAPAQLLSPLAWYYNYWIAIGIVSLVAVAVGVSATYSRAVERSAMSPQGEK